MKHVGLIAFGVTVCALVPAAVKMVNAGREQAAKLFAPSSRTLELDDGAGGSKTGGTRIDASLDRALVDPGDTIHVKLAATAATARHVSVGVLVLGSTGTEESRVPSPPVGVAHETVSLDLDATGHATKEIPIRLRGAIARYEPFAHYTILIMPPKAASKLERLRSHARVIPDKSGGIPELNRSGEKFQAMYWAIKSEQAPAADDGNKGGDKGDEKGDDELFAPGKIARLEAHTAPRSAAITITAPDTAQRDRTFTVAVTVKNPGKRALTGLEVSLETLDGMLDDQMQGRYAGVPGSEVTIEATNTKLDLAGHETKRVEFHVTANADGVVGLYARASCGEDCRDVETLLAGAVEATEIVEAPSVVGAR